MNTAVEASDEHPEMFDWAQTAMRERTFLVSAILDSGVASGEFRSDLDRGSVAQLMLSSIHGALVLCKLNQNNQPMHATTAALRSLLLTAVLSPSY